MQLVQMVPWGAGLNSSLSIVKSLGATPIPATWITASYPLTQGALVLMSGCLGAVYDDKNVLLVGCVWWTSLGEEAQISDLETTRGSGEAMSMVLGSVAGFARGAVAGVIVTEKAWAVGQSRPRERDQYAVMSARSSHFFNSLAGKQVERGTAANGTL